MKINKVNIPAINPYKANEAKMDKMSGKQHTQKDKLEISTAAKKLSEMKAPNAERAQYIASLKEQVNAGTYEVDAQAVAQSLVKYYQ